ncbi:MAG: hypothetical protein EPN47_05055 [Acidobacteria bacterium]|nr:MAG: hypothetical protein EPN47_05055 [Acidobacteriota bacterium]
MTQGIKTYQMAKDEATAALPSDRSSGEESDGSKKATPNFNRYLYDNFLSNLENQIESWDRSAVRDPNPEVAHALWLKAEGLGYALRLLYAFEPEFRELVECASLVAEIKDPDSTVQHLERKSS